jgi:hypothetical protein
VCYSKFDPSGICCSGCAFAILGYADPTLAALFWRLDNDPDRLESLANASLPGHDVVLGTSESRNYKLPAGGRWSCKVVGPTSGSLYSFFGMAPLFSFGAGGNFDFVWAPADATGEDIYSDQSLMIRVTTSPYAMLFSSDWDDSGYPFGVGNQSFHPIPPSLQYIGVLRDSISGIGVGANPYVGTSLTIVGTSIKMASFHRPIKHEIPRRFHVINNTDTDWYFDGFVLSGVTDDRTPNRDATGKCPSLFVDNRATINNEPFLIDATLGGDRDATGRLASIRSANDHGLFPPDGVRWVGRSQARRATYAASLAYRRSELDPGEEDGDVAFIPLVGSDLDYRLEFGPTEILTVDADGKPATVQCEANLKVFRNHGFFDLLYEVDFTFPIAAWDRGQMPTITIVPGGSPGTIVANGEPGTCTEWPLPQIANAYKFVWNSSLGWVPQDEYAYDSYTYDDLDHELVILPAEIGA